jgi:hypothetical protein
VKKVKAIPEVIEYEPRLEDIDDPSSWSWYGDDKPLPGHADHVYGKDLKNPERGGVAVPRIRDCTASNNKQGPNYVPRERRI